MSGFSEPSDVVDTLKKELNVLQAQRDALELEADAIAGELRSPGANGERPVGVKGSLVDSDGYPLAGFDLFNVRDKRHRLNCIQTDHKAVMGRVETSLHALHEATRSSSSSNSAAPAPSTVEAVRRTAPSEERAGANTSQSASVVPIAKVNQVSEGSPAATAGMTVGDLVLRFGEVDVSHPKGLSAVVEVVRDNEGQEVTVTVLRHGGRGGQSGIKDLKLVPKTWNGRGLLGVHLLPP